MRRLGPFVVLSTIVCAPALSGEAQVQKELLSPLGQGFTYVPSPAPVDLVTVGPAGSRMAVYRNGEAGPKFDEILTTEPTPEGGGGIAVVFSADGTRHAYVGRKRDQFTLMVDGEEALTGKFDRGYNKITGVGFTADNRLFYRLQQQDEAGQAPWRFVLDGKSSPELAPENFQVLLSPVGDGYVLLGKRMNPREPVFLRDGQEVESRASNFVYRHDGKLFTLEYDGDANETVLRLDGEELFRGDYQVQEIVPAPAGESWALIGTSRSKGTNCHIVLNGEEIDGQVSNMVGSQRIWFSDDGAHWATIMQPAIGRQYVVIDGERQDEYQSIQELSFSPDGSRIAYWGRSPSGAYLVLDGEEQDGVSSITPPVVWGGDGAHVGWAEVGVNPARHCVLFDGQRYEGDHQLYHTTIGLSPDGTRMAFMEGGTVIEFEGGGVKRYEETRVVAAGVDNRGGYRPLPNGFLFSPDGRFLVFHGNDVQAGGQGVFFNGKLAFEAPGPAVLRLGFSPDSQHFFLTMGTGSERTLYVDGVAVMKYGPQPFEQEESMWSIDDSGVLHFMIVGEQGIQRVSVTPSPDRSVADLVGG